MTTVAGTGAAGYSGDKGLATSARFNETVGIALDASGNIYVSDAYYHVIRVITKSTGIITTVAGTGRRRKVNFKYTKRDGVHHIGDGGVVHHIGTDDTVDSGRLDTGDDEDGFYDVNEGYYTGDGGLATNATLSGPQGIALDTSGNIYVADVYNNVIRKITKSSGIITTVVGTGLRGYEGDGGIATSARLWKPQTVAVDATGNIFIADRGNGVIRKVTFSTGFITTIAGSGIFGYSGDGGLATAAKLAYPAGIALDSSGNIYFADYNNYRIRKITSSTGIITTVCGTGSVGAVGNGDGGLATAAAIYLARGITLDSSENIYFTDEYYNVIRKITKSTGIITTVAGTAVVDTERKGALTSTQTKTKTTLDIQVVGERERERVRKREK